MGKGLTVAEQARAGAFVQAQETKIADDPESGAFRCAGRARYFALHLESDFDDFERVREDDLAAACRTAGQRFVAPPDCVRLLVGEDASDEIVDSEFDGLFGCDADHLRPDARVEAADAFVLDDFARAFYRVLVQEFANAAAALILHASLDQVDRIHHERAKGTSHRA